ncbi:MAG: cation transporter, partial [Gemmataceae bacterium]|nr:cation transporter [Gemmataceae bacterium]
MATQLAADPLTEKAAPQENGRLVQIKASGMMCSFCTMSVEKALGRLPGVNHVQVNLVHGVILVDREPRQISAERLEQAVESLGYNVVATEAQQYQTDEAIFATIKKRGFLAMGLAVLDLLVDPLNLLGWFGLEPHPLFRPLFSLVIALVVLTWVGFPILRKTLMALRNRVIN